jgi:mannitol-specific phosphotransferase system IIBC component
MPNTTTTTIGTIGLTTLGIAVFLQVLSFSGSTTDGGPVSQGSVSSVAAKGNMLGLILGIVFGVFGCLLLAGILAFVIIRKKRQNKGEKKEKVPKSKKNSKSASMVETSDVAMETIKKDRFKISDIEIQKKLGGGNFGEVYKGLWKVYFPWEHSSFP